MIVQDTWYGPYSGTQLQKWNNSRSWSPDFPVCHGPSGIWLPVWLVLQLLGFPAASATVAGASAAVGGQHQAGNCIPAQTLDTPDDVEYGSVSGHRHQQQRIITQHQPNHHHASAHQHTQHSSTYRNGSTPSSAGSDQEYGWRSTQRPTSAAAAQGPTTAAGGNTSSHIHNHNINSRPQVTAAAAEGSAAAQTVGHFGTDGGYDDADMSEWHAEMMHEVQLLRQDSGFLQELNRAVDMEWEPQQQQEQLYWSQRQQILQDGLGEPATSLAGVGTSGSSLLLQQHQHWVSTAGTSVYAGLLILVVDTNVLLERRGLALLQQVQAMRLQGALPLFVVVPWTVLVELDQLKHSK